MPTGELKKVHVRVVKMVRYSKQEEYTLSVYTKVQPMSRCFL